MGITFDWAKPEVNSNSQQHTAFTNCFSKFHKAALTTDCKMPDSTNTHSKTTDKGVEKSPSDSLILQHSKNKIIKHMELRNSIEDNLKNDPFANHVDSNYGAVKSTGLQVYDDRENNTREFNMSSLNKRFLYRSVKPKIDLSKPKIKQNKAKSAKVPVQSNIKISINNIKVRVVQTSTN